MSQSRKQVRSDASRWLRRFVLLTATGAMVSACATPVGRAPELQGSYWGNALVTHPNDDGPQVVRWGPPQNYFPDAGTGGGGH